MFKSILDVICHIQWIININLMKQQNKTYQMIFEMKINLSFHYALHMMFTSFTNVTDSWSYIISCPMGMSHQSPSSYFQNQWKHALLIHISLVMTAHTALQGPFVWCMWQNEPILLLKWYYCTIPQTNISWRSTTPSYNSGQ